MNVLQLKTLNFSTFKKIDLKLFFTLNNQFLYLVFLRHLS